MTSWRSPSAPEDDGGVNVTHYFVEVYPASPCVAAKTSGARTNMDKTYYCNSDIDGGMWTLYLLNGKGEQHKETLRYGKNAHGYGSIGPNQISAPEIGAYKMPEAEFDAMKFTEVLALVGGDENAGEWSQYAARTVRPNIRCGVRREQQFWGRFGILTSRKYW